MRESIKKALHVCENDIHDIKKLHFIASSQGIFMEENNNHISTLTLNSNPYNTDRQANTCDGEY